MHERFSLERDLLGLFVVLRDVVLPLSLSLRVKLSSDVFFEPDIVAVLDEQASTSTTKELLSTLENDGHNRVIGSNARTSPVK